MTLQPTIFSLEGIFQRELVIFLTIFIGSNFIMGMEEWYSSLSFMFIIFFPLEGLPILWYSWSYYRFNKDHTFELQTDYIQVDTGNTRKKYLYSEIDRINIYMSGNNPRFHMAILVPDFFHFAEIVMKNGESVVITSICHHQVDMVLEETYPDVPMEYKWGGGTLKRLQPKNS